MIFWYIIEDVGCGYFFLNFSSKYSDSNSALLLLQMKRVFPGIQSIEKSENITHIIFKSFVTFLNKVLIKHDITYHASFCYLCDYATQILLMPLLQDKSNHEVLVSAFLERNQY